jgi:hypothetical protein
MYWWFTNRLRNVNKPGVGGTFKLSPRKPRKKTYAQCFSILYYSELNLRGRASRLQKMYESELKTAEDEGVRAPTLKSWLEANAPQSAKWPVVADAAAGEDPDDVEEDEDEDDEDDDEDEDGDGSAAKKSKSNAASSLTVRRPCPEVGDVANSSTDPNGRYQCRCQRGDRGAAPGDEGLFRIAKLAARVRERHGPRRTVSYLTVLSSFACRLPQHII